MKLMPTIKSCCLVGLTISDSLTVKREVLLCSRWVNVLTLTYKTQLAFILSICCNIQHLTQQRSQSKLQWSKLPHNTFRHIWRADTANWQCGLPNNVIKRKKARADWRQKESEPLGYCIGQHEMQNEACVGETTRNASLNQWRDREIVWGLCWERNRRGKKASRRRRGSGSARAEWNEACWNHRIDDQRARQDFWGDDGSYPRQSEWSCKFRRWGGWGRWCWCRDSAGQAERRWRTQLGDGHNHQNGAAAHGGVSGDVDEGWRNDTTGMGGCSRLLPWKRWQVRNIWIEGSGCHSTTNGWWHCGTFAETICRGYGVSSDCPRNLANAARVFWTRQ